jgi:hypothetical protein
MEYLTTEKQETVAKIMELIDGGESFYELALELAFTQKVDKEVYEQIEKQEGYYLKISIMFIKRIIFMHELERVIKKLPHSTYIKNTRIDGRSILVKEVDCQKCLPF